MMNIIWNFGHGVMVLPECARAGLPGAGEAELRVLLALTDTAVLQAPDRASALSGATGLGNNAVKKALDYWQKQGVITIQMTQDEQPARNLNEASASDTAPTKPAVSVHTDTEMPHYSSDEIGRILESRSDIADLIALCSQSWGKMFNAHEASQIIGMVDYLGFDPICVCELVAFVAEGEHKSLRNVEKLAMALYDEGVVEVSAVEERLRAVRARNDLEGQVRKLFGLQSRALTTKEKKMLDTWSGEFRYGFDIVQRAYEETINAIGKPAIPYANAVLERWNAENLRTLDEIERHMADRAAGKQPQNGSFNTDEFFAAALKRSYGADYDRQMFAVNADNGANAGNK